MCEHNNTIFLEGLKTCTDCGLIFDEPVYITSYNRSFSYRRPPVYSRQKRFYHFVLSVGNSCIFQVLENIMTLFGRLEFFWTFQPNRSRKYFFNRFVTLVFILKELSIDTEGMRTLKDKERVQIQMNDMAEILKNSIL